LPIAVVLTDDAKRVFVGREGDLLVAFVVDYSKSVGESELDCYFA
jgi:hypothetical protein